MLDGWNMQAIRDTKEWEIGSGQLWHPQYDRYDPLTIQDSHGIMNEEYKINFGSTPLPLIGQFKSPGNKNG